MAVSDSCTLSILVSRPDVPYMLHTIPHIVRSCQRDFAERVLIVDTAPLHPRYAHLSETATLAALRQCCNQLVVNKIIDQVVDIDYSTDTMTQLSLKHFGCRLRNTRNHRGYPILGMAFAIERAQGRFFLHFDSDMLIHQCAGSDWIGDAIGKMRQNANILFASPLSGPPDPSGSLKQRDVQYSHDARGYYVFKHFSSRKFLVDRERLDAALPLAPAYISRCKWLTSFFTGKSALCNWEHMVSNMLAATSYIRADLDSHSAWTLHTPDHEAEFLAKLPSVIQRVEAGQFPREQAGDYDLRLDHW